MAAELSLLRWTSIGFQQRISMSRCSKGCADAHKMTHSTSVPKFDKGTVR